MTAKDIRERIREQVVNDYFTPNIKAEVILDMLLTPYIERILENECGIHAVFLTKEMSMENFEEKKENKEIKENEKKNNDMGAKIDYVLADVNENGPVYLVELKTTTGSIGSRQAYRYISCCYDKEQGKPRTFGEVFGEKLLRLLRGLKGLKRSNGQPWSIEEWINDNPEEDKDNLKEEIAGGCGSDKCAEEAGKAADKGEHDGYAEKTRQFLKQNKYVSTYKYLYTVGQILDHLYPDAVGQISDCKAALAKLWERELRLVYITPEGKLPHRSFSEYKEDFYISPRDKGSIDLREAVKELKARDGDKEYLDMLKDIVEDIYKQ